MAFHVAACCCCTPVFQNTMYCFIVVWILLTSIVGVALTSFTVSSLSPTPSTMVSPPADATLPRWDLNLRFGFASPFDPAIDRTYYDCILLLLMPVLATYLVSKRSISSSKTTNNNAEHLEETQQRAVQFQSNYEGKLNEVSLLAAVSEYEAIAVRRATLSSYLSLHYDVDLENDELKKRKGAISQKQASYYGDHLEWFTLDLAEMSSDDLEAQYAKEDGGLLRYKAFLDEVRRQRPHNLEK